MESSIAKRDKIGVQDFVLLEDFKSETAFVENLKKRYHENLIYVSMALLSVLVFSYCMLLDVHWKRVGIGQSVQDHSRLVW